MRKGKGKNLCFSPSNDSFLFILKCTQHETALRDGLNCVLIEISKRIFNKKKFFCGFKIIMRNKVESET